MTSKQYDQCYFSKSYVRINYETSYSHGFMIIKSDLYEIKEKKIKKAFKDCNNVEVIENYKVTLKDFVDSAIEKIKSRLSFHKWRIDNYRRFNYEEDVIKEACIIDELSSKLVRLLRKGGE